VINQVANLITGLRPSHDISQVNL